MDIIELTSTNFKKIVESSTGRVLVYFWAPWCGHCIQMQPALEWVKDTLGSNIIIGKVNVDENSDLAQGYFVRSVPTLILFEDGVLKKRAVGSMNKEQLTSWVY